MPDPAAELIRLADLPHDTAACLTEIRGGHHLTRRLLALGLRQGCLFSVVQRRSQGLVLASGETRIAVGAGIAEKLWVTPMAAPTAPEPSDPPSPAAVGPDPV